MPVGRLKKLLRERNMDIAELVRNIVREVLREWRPGQTRIRVLAARNDALALRLRGLVGADAELVFAGEAREGEAFARHVLPSLSCSDMADLAVGRAAGPLMAEVQELLLQGLAVEVLDFAYHAYSETAPGPLYRLYEAHEAALAGFGLTAFRARAPEAVRQWDDLVTAETVKQAAATGTGVLLVPASAKVTPLAVETAAERHISIQKRL